MRRVSNTFCAVFCVLLTVRADPEPDFERFRLAATLVPLSKNENVFISPNSTKVIKDITENDTTIDGQNSTGILVPKVFPNGETDGVKIKNFDENLLHKERNATSPTGIPPTDTEVKDLLRVNNNISTSPNSNTTLKPKIIPDEANDEAELIENGQDTEDSRVLNHQHVRKLEEIEKIEPDPLGHGSIAAIFVGALTLVVVLCYVGMLSWRKYLERKYGSRQILVNEDDFALEDPNDLRHFSI